MSCALLQHDVIKEFSQIWIDYLRGGATQLVNTNKLVRFYQGTTGLKTGTTDEAGFCVSASAERNNMELVAVVLNGETSDKRFSDAKKLLDYGFANWGIVSIDMSQIPLEDVKVKHGMEGSVPVSYEVMDTILCPQGQAECGRPHGQFARRCGSAGCQRAAAGQNYLYTGGSGGGRMPAFRRRDGGKNELWPGAWPSARLAHSDVASRRRYHINKLWQYAVLVPFMRAKAEMLSPFLSLHTDAVCRG